jgi:hypothetical protein
MNNLTSSTSNTRPEFLYNLIFNEQGTSSNLSERRENLVKEIDNYWRENTDGHSENFEEPVKAETFQNALKFINMLPLTHLPNEIVPVSRRGHLGFDWNNSDGRSFTLVVSDLEVYFAANLNNGQRLKGNVPFNFNKIPVQIMDAITLTFQK